MKFKKLKIREQVSLVALLLDGIDCDGIDCDDCPLHLDPRVTIGTKGYTGCLSVLMKDRRDRDAEIIF
jgi:hypothetical protein